MQAERRPDGLETADRPEVAGIVGTTEPAQGAGPETLDPETVGHLEVEDTAAPLSPPRGL
jgi:hypothetical protein